MKAHELTGCVSELKTKILKSKGVKFYINSSISFSRVRISKKQASESVFSNVNNEVVFSDYEGGILITRMLKHI
jgi:hypothetical protein